MDQDRIASPAMVEKLMRVNGYQEKFDQYMIEYPIVIVSRRHADGYEDLLEKRVEYAEVEMPGLDQAFFEIYKKNFTANEILELIAFFKTPIGKKLVEIDEDMRIEMQTIASSAASRIAAKMIKDQFPEI